MQGRWTSLGLASAVICLVSGCTTTPEEPAATTSAITYGENGNTDVYEHPNALMQGIARESVAVMVRTQFLEDADRDDIRFTRPTLGEHRSLCPSEPFATQQAAAYCTAVLIDHDLVLTAGSCLGREEVFDDVTRRERCGDTYYVFDYVATADGRETIRSSDVYACREILARERTEVTSFYDRQHDFAVVQLDRPVYDVPLDGRGTLREPVTLAADVAPPIASRSILIGSYDGTPLKIEDTGYALYTRPPYRDFFGTSNDMFSGQHGAGAFDEAGRLLGVASRASGAAYVHDDARGCFEVAEGPMSGSYGGRATEITYAHRAIDALCEGAGFPSPLCGRTPECGDGVCSGTETDRTCAADCDPPECGDGRCYPSEWDSCPFDCTMTIGSRVVPPTWTCDDDLWFNGDGCHCGCGAPDPDCDWQPRPANGCAAGERCTDTGTCEPDPSAGGVPEGWTCFAASYGFEDGCHCGCGIYDPDCDDDSAEIVGCEAGQVCEAAACVTPAPDAGAPPVGDGGVGPMPDGGVSSVVDAGTSEDGGGGGCSVSPRAPAGTLPWLVLAAAAGFVRRRRERRRP